MSQNTSNPIDRLDSYEGSEPESDLDASAFVEYLDSQDGQIDEPYVDIIAEYTKDIEPKMTSLGWEHQNAKTSVAPFYKYGMSMQNHTRTGVFFLLRLFGDLIPDSLPTGQADRKVTLRELVALFVIHDFHKIRHNNNGIEGEFDIPRDDVKQLVNDIGLLDFAPTLEIDDFHAVAVALHKSNNSKTEMMTRKVCDLHPILYVADTAASVSDVSDFGSERLKSVFASSTRKNAIPHSHSLDAPAGMTTSILNKAIANAFQNVGFELLTIHEGGCSYVEKFDTETEFEESQDRDAEFVPVGKTWLLNNIYKEFITELRKAFPESRNKSLLSQSAEEVRGAGQYYLEPLDMLLLPQDDLISSVVQKGMTQAYAPFELSKKTMTDINGLRDLSTVEFATNSFRIEGLARIVYSFYDTFVKPLTKIARQNGEQDPVRAHSVLALIDAFDLSKDITNEIHSLWNEYNETVGNRWKLDIPNTRSDFPFKYLFAQDLLDRKEIFAGEKPADTVEYISNMLSRWITENFSDEWTTFIDQKVGSVDIELKAKIFRAIDFDNVSLHTDKHSLPADAELFDMGNCKHDCELCGNETIAEDEEKLISKSIEMDIDVEFDGDVLNLKKNTYQGRICYWCQLDISFQAQDTSWPSVDEEPDELENRLHIVSRPDYAYTPLSGILYSHTLDRFSATHTAKELSLATDICDSDYDDMNEWVEMHAENSFGRAIISNYQRAFMLGDGFGASFSNISLSDGEKIESQFSGVSAVNIASLKSGLSSYVSSKPIVRQPSESAREIVELSPELEEIVGIVGGKKFSLKKMTETVEAVSGIHRLTDATGHSHAPVSAYKAFNRNETFILPGSALFHKAVSNGNKPEDYATDALVVDKFGTKDAAWENDIAKLSVKLSDLAYIMVGRPNNYDDIIKIVSDCIKFILTFESLPASRELTKSVIEYIETNESVEIDDSYHSPENIRTFAATLVDTGVNQIGCGSKEQFEALSSVILAGSAPAAVSLTNGDRNPYEMP